MTFEFTQEALEELKKLGKVVRKRIVEKIKYWSNMDNPMQFSKSLQGEEGLFRFRVGDWRMIVDSGKKNSIRILKIGHRSKIYDPK